MSLESGGNICGLYRAAVLIIYCCVTHYPTTEQLTPTNICYLGISVGQESGCDLLGASGSRSLTGCNRAVALGSGHLQTWIHFQAHVCGCWQASVFLGCWAEGLLPLPYHLGLSITISMLAFPLRRRAGQTVLWQPNPRNNILSRSPRSGGGSLGSSHTEGRRITSVHIPGGGARRGHSEAVYCGLRCRCTLHVPF